MNPLSALHNTHRINTNQKVVNSEKNGVDLRCKTMTILRQCGHYQQSFV